MQSGNNVSSGKWFLPIGRTFGTILIFEYLITYYLTPVGEDHHNLHS